MAAAPADPSTGAVRPRHDPYSAFRNPSFPFYLSGNILATMGQQMQTVAVGWELYERTGSALALGGVGLAQVLPIFLLTLPAGHVADRYQRKRVLMFAQFLFVLSSAGLAGVSLAHGSLGLFYLFLLMTGTARAFQGPAKGSLLPQIVDPLQFGNAVTWSSVGWQLAAVIGPAIGGLVIGLAHRAAPVYIIDAGTALAFLLLLIPVKPLVGITRAPTLRGLLGGIEFLRKTPVLLAAITLDLFAVLLGGAVTLLPIFAKDILRVGPSGLGWLLAAPSAGAVLMTVALAHRPPFQRAGPVLLRAVIGFGLATIVFGFSRNYLLSFLMLVLLGALDSISVVIRATLVQVRTPDELRGRVAAINSLFIGTSNELGGFESGAVAAAIGPVASVVVGGIGTIAVVLIVAWVWPSIRTLTRLEEEAA